jgi:hypothetical protein
LQTFQVEKKVRSVHDAGRRIFGLAPISRVVSCLSCFFRPCPNFGTRTLRCCLRTLSRWMPEPGRSICYTRWRRRDSWRAFFPRTLAGADSRPLADACKLPSISAPRSAFVMSAAARSPAASTGTSSRSTS